MKEEILLEWNPWWVKKPEIKAVERAVYSKIEPWLKRREILTFLGARRAGKTTFMYLLIEKLLGDVPAKNILFIKCDDDRVEKKDLIDNALETYYRLMNPKKERFLLFIDEIQEVDGWQKTLKRIYDLNKKVKILISGSNASILREELSYLLSGRFAYFSLYPFSFSEFLEAKNIKLKGKADILHKKSLILHHLREYMEFGGFPEVVLEQKKKLKQELLRFYYDSILYRDVVKRYSIKSVAKLDRLVAYLLSNISNLANFTKIGRQTSLSTDSVVDYCKFLEEAYFIFTIPIFSYSVKAQQINPKKVYCVDMGLRNAMGFRFSEDIGRLAENLVFIELKRQEKTVFYWKDSKGRGIDFVVKEGLKPAQAIQVCWDISKEVKKKEVEALVSGIEEFKLSKGIVLTGDYEGVKRIKGKRIVFAPLWKWLLGV